MSLSLTHLVGEYLSSHRRPACTPDHAGVHTFDAGDGMLVCANELGDDCMELYASPGYKSASELPCARADEDDEDRDDDDELEACWHGEDGVPWSERVNPMTGLVTLAALRLEAPTDLAGFKEALEAFRLVYVTYEARLRAARDPETISPEADEDDAIARAMFLRA
jgi:hypothetical protein